MSLAQELANRSAQCLAAREEARRVEEQKRQEALRQRAAAIFDEQWKDCLGACETAADEGQRQVTLSPTFGQSDLWNYNADKLIEKLQAEGLKVVKRQVGPITTDRPDAYICLDVSW